MMRNLRELGRSRMVSARETSAPESLMHRVAPPPPQCLIFLLRRLIPAASRPEFSPSAGQCAATRQPASSKGYLDFFPACAVAGSHSASRRRRHGLAAVLLGLPLLLGLAVPDEAYAQSCNVSTATTRATEAFNYHRDDSGGNLPTATAAYRVLIALGDNPLPEWTGDNISGNAPTTPISEADLRTFLTGRGDTWVPWNAVYTALNCLEALPAVTVTGGPAVTEGAGAQFTVSVSQTQNSALTVNLRITDDDNSDFVASGAEGSKTILIPANQGSATYTVPTTNDKADEPDGQVTAAVTGGSSYRVGDPAMATVTVNDNDKPSPADRVQMSFAKRSVAEFGDNINAIVEVGDGGKLAGHNRTITYTLGGSAERGDGKDYTIDFGSHHSCEASNCTVRLPANTKSVPILIKPNDDYLDETDETIVITLQAEDGAGYTLNAKKTTTITITDDDTRGLTFYRAWPDVDEGSSETYTVRLASQPTAAVTVAITSDNPDVTVNPASPTFNPSGSNLWSTAQTVTISAAQDDDAVDDTATLTYTASGGDYDSVSVERPVSVDDDDTADPVTSQVPVINLTGGAAVTEGSPASFTVEASPAPTVRITVNVEVLELPSQDFVAASQEGVRTVILNAGATTTVFTVSTVDDNTDEDDGAVQVFVNDGTGYSAGGGNAVDINDNDNPISTVSFRSASSSAAEDDGTHLVPVDFGGAAPSGGLTLRYSVAGTATAGSSNDFTIQNSGTLSVAAGDPSAALTVAINDDNAAENAETVILTLIGGAGYTVGSPGGHTLTIADNDSTAASFAASSSSAAEDAGTHNVTVNLSQAAPAGGLTLSYRVTGTATAGSGNDFTIQSSGTVTITANSASATIPVAINDDSTAENDETVILTLTGGTGYTLGTTTTHTLTITGNDRPPITADFWSGNGVSTLPEGATEHFGITFDRPLGSTEMVTLLLAIGGTATRGTDYRLTCGSVGSEEVSFTCNGLNGNSPSITFDGALARTHRVTGLLHLEALADNTSESEETVTLTLDGGETLTMKITDAPSSVTLGFNRATYSVNEGAAIFQPVIALSQASGSDLTIPLIFTNITATAGADYTSLSQVVLEANGRDSYSFDIPILDDTLFEGDETFRVAIDTANLPSGVTAGATTAATITITDNDSALSASFASGSLTVAEDAGTRNVRVDLSSAAPSGGLTLGYSVGGTATGSDFSIQNPGSLSVAAGATAANIPVVINDDGTSEGTETVILTLTSGTGYTVGSPSVHTLTITDNDAPPDTPNLVLGSSSLTVSEGGTGRYTVRLATAPTGAVTVAIASDNTDVTVSPSSLTFNPSGSNSWSTARTVTVSVSRDADFDDDSATLTHTPSGGGYDSVAVKSVAVMVVDDGPPRASFASASSSAGEDAGTRNVRVNLSLAPASATTLSYTVTGTATAGSDYDTLSGMAPVPAGSLSVNIPVVITDDGDEEPAETVVLTLTDVMGYTLGTTTVHTLTITSSDHAPVAQDSAVRVPAAGSYTFTPADFKHTDADGDALASVTVVTLPQMGELALGGEAVSAGDPVLRTALAAGRLVYTPAEGQEGTASFMFQVKDETEDESNAATMTLTLVSLDAERLTRGWLARFGRAAADQVIGAVEERLRAPMAASSTVRLAGRDWQDPDPNALASSGETGSGILANTLDTLPEPSLASGGLPSLRETAPTGLSRLDWLGGSAFNLTRQSGSGLKSVWGRGAVTQFDAREADARLDGRVASVLLGADFVQDGQTLGILLSHSRGKGGYQGKNTGDRLEADLTGAYPYARYEVNERLSLWGVAGYGEGDLERTRDAETQKVDLDSWMAAGGLRGQVRGASAGWPELSAVADVLWVDTETDGEADFPSVDADVSRIRAGLEGSWAPTPLGHGQLSPRLRISLRHDGGDAEHGFGTEVRAGADWADARHGLRAQVQAHTLLTHEEDGAQEKGFSGSLSWDPRPGSLRGAEFSLAASAGAQPNQNGMLSDAAFGTDPARESAPSWEATLGYGVGAFGDRFTAVPEASLARSADAWDLGLGWRLVAERFDLRLQAQHRAASGEDTGFGLDLQLQGRW